MSDAIDSILASIGEEYRNAIEPGGRHYVEVNIGQRANTLGIVGLLSNVRAANAIIPLKAPLPGMKVRIDGRTFVNYAQFDSGVAVPEHAAKFATLRHHAFRPQDSMVLNFH